ncbi:hypothetical protein J6590_059457 [Homalodisca vitripennis]|nr:hypothetical protein J6590_059457 [Homalodisca vitripennis]
MAQTYIYIAIDLLRIRSRDIATRKSQPYPYVTRLSLDNRIKQRLVWLLLGWHHYDTRYAHNVRTVTLQLRKEYSTTNPGEVDKTSAPADAYVVMYSVIDKASFQRAEDEMGRLQDYDLLRARPAILVANKVDLVRSRAVSSQDGKCLACTYRAKFIEISVGINHNVDELLVGILNQIRMKRACADRESGSHWYKSRGVVRASMKARQMFTWIFGKEDSKFKNCENLHVL